MPSSPSSYSGHNFVLILENSEGDQRALGGFDEAGALPQNPLGRHKVDLALRRGVCDAKSLWDWVLAQRGRPGAGPRWRNAILTEVNAGGNSKKSWRLESARPKRCTAPAEGVDGDVAIEELVLSVEYIGVRLRA